MGVADQRDVLQVPEGEGSPPIVQPARERVPANDREHFEIDELRRVQRLLVG